MNAHEEERLEQLLQKALPPINDSEPTRDLWPAMLQRLHGKAPATTRFDYWFDWALAGGLAVCLLAFPAVIPVFLYCL